jgi:hypothetical protein
MTAHYWNPLLETRTGPHGKRLLLLRKPHGLDQLRQAPCGAVGAASRSEARLDS